MLFSSTHGCLSQVHVLLLLFIIHNNGAMPLLFFYQMEAAGGLLFDVLPRPVESAGCVLCYALSCNLPFFSSYTPLCLSVSCHFPSGMEPDTPYDLERSSDRRFPLKKPCFPQYRNRSLDCPAGTRCMYLFLLLLICVGWQPCGRLQQKNVLSKFYCKKFNLIFVKSIKSKGKVASWRCTWLSHTIHIESMLVAVFCKWLTRNKGDHKNIF